MDIKNSIDRLIEKSKEAFILGVEIYNKPTIKYRIEGFSFFICNAWELLLKAYIIKIYGYDTIYHNDSKRIKGLSDCVGIVFTNNKDPLRLNLEKIIELRNISTHYIVEDYEQIYVPLFQACVFNYINKLKDFFEDDITNILSSNFIVLATNYTQITFNEIQARYPTEISDKIIDTIKNINELSNKEDEIFSIPIVHNFYQVKNNKNAAATFRISNDAKDSVFILKKMNNINETHPYTPTQCAEKINNKIIKNEIEFSSDNDNKENKFNCYHFGLFKKYYNLTSDIKFCYVHKVNNKNIYTYTQQTIDFIFDEIKKNPENIIRDLKNYFKK